jgi:uncharacterized protein YcbK (DUF882 family)
MECDGARATLHGGKNFRLTPIIDFCYKRQTENTHRGETFLLMLRSVSVSGADRSKWVWTRRTFLQASLVGTLLLSGRFVGPQPVQARELPEGRLVLVNAWTDERLDVTYRDASGNYDLEALDDVNYLMRCHYSGEVGAIDVRVLEHVNFVQNKLGTKKDIHFISGFRSPEYNALLVRKGGHAARNSLHMQGQAIDLLIPSVHPKKLRQAALELRYGGVGFYKRSRFVHLDSGPFRFW